MRMMPVTSARATGCLQAAADMFVPMSRTRFKDLLLASSSLRHASVSIVSIMQHAPLHEFLFKP